MTGKHDPATILTRPDVKQYFLSILDSTLSSNEKYNRFIDFFDVAERIRGKLMTAEFSFEETELVTGPEAGIRAAAEAAHEADLWNPSEILDITRSSIQRALQSFGASKRPDGGWGYLQEPANVWGTCHVLLSLMRADKALEVNYDRELYIDEAIAWLASNQSGWSTCSPMPNGGWKTCEAALVIRTLVEAGDRVESSLLDTVEHTIQRVIAAQNKDGGWHVRIGDTFGSAGNWSDTGATSVVTRAIAAWGRHKEKTSESFCLIPYREAVDSALEWLDANLNSDGTWNRQVLTDGRLVQVASITKTCDAINALLTGGRFVQREWHNEIGRAVAWVLDQESLLLNEGGQVKGWGFQEFPNTMQPENPSMDLYEDFARKDLNCTCLALETLVRLDSVALPALWANARWLIAAQREDGAWQEGDPFRITLGLIHFCRRLKEDSLWRVREQTAGG